jgi:carbamoyl-phosphate synthase large subunit
MGIDTSFPMAFYKSQLAAGQSLPKEGKVFISVKDEDKRSISFIAKKLFDMNFEILTTKGTHKVLKSNNINATLVGKIGEGDHQILELIRKDELKLIINTPSGQRGQSDMKPIRSLAVLRGIPCITTIPGAQAAVNGIESLVKGDLAVKSIQDHIADNGK